MSHLKDSLVQDTIILTISQLKDNVVVYLVGGVEIHPVLAGIDESYTRLWEVVHQAESVSQ